MTAYKIKSSDLSRMIKESVKKVLSDSAMERIPEDSMEEEITMEQLTKLVKSTVSEAFGEKGDKNGELIGGGFGDAKGVRNPLSEAKRKKTKDTTTNGLPPWLKGKGFKKKGSKAADKDDDKKDSKKKESKRNGNGFFKKSSNYQE